MSIRERILKAGRTATLPDIHPSSIVGTEAKHLAAAREMALIIKERIAARYKELDYVFDGSVTKSQLDHLLAELSDGQTERKERIEMTRDLWICLIALAILIGLCSGWLYNRYKPRPDVMVSDGPVEHLSQRDSTTAQRVTWANTYTSSTNYDVIPDTGTYMYDDNGHPRYVIKGKDVSREAFERAFPGSTKVTR